MKTDSWIIVDVEASGPCPGLGSMTEVGAVLFSEPPFPVRFYGHLAPITNVTGSEVEIAGIKPGGDPPGEVMDRFRGWIEASRIQGKRPIFVSDNPAFDFQWTHYYFCHYLGSDPFGWSGRRIGDIYAGLVRSTRRPWKRLRETPHDHNPVNDALGNAEALHKMIEYAKGKRPSI